MPVPILCRAKLNLFLDVVGRRPDGYHDIVTVFHEVKLADELHVTFTRGAGGHVNLQVVSDDLDVSDVPTDARNLAVRGLVAACSDLGGEMDADVLLIKRIPAGGGLGGGSADAAGAIRAAFRFCFRCPDPARMERIAATLGSDVPFLVRGGTAIGRGRGEILERIDGVPSIPFGLLFPTFGTSTAAVYRNVRTFGDARRLDDVVAALRAGDVERLAASCWNALEEPAVRAEPRLGDALAAARAEFGPHVHVTGSGSTLFVVGPGDDFAARATALSARCPLFRGFAKA